MKNVLKNKWHILSIHPTKALLNYTIKDYVLITLLIICSQRLLEWLQLYGSYLGVQYPPHTQQIGLGLFTKHFIYSQLVIVLLTAIIISHRSSTNLRKLPNLHRLLIYGLIGLVAFTFGSIILEGVGHFYLLGYRNLNISFLIYLSVALYLVLKFRNGDILKTLLLVTLAILTVSHIWEMPYVFAAYINSGSNLYFWIIGFMEWSIPIVFWLHTTRKIFQTFIFKHPGIVVVFVSIIIGVTIGSFVFRLLGRYWMPIGFTLRSAYALLLVFLPFHYYVKK